LTSSAFACRPTNIGPGDRFINEQLDSFPRTRKIAIVTKTDAAGSTKVAEQLLAVSELREWDLVIPLSAVTGEQVDLLAEQVIALMPESPALYDDDAVTDESTSDRVAELIREAALEGVSDELPHSLAVTIDEMAERSPGGVLDIFANVFVERDSQKGIIIGHKGSRLTEVGTRARLEIEQLMGRRVYLKLHVKVAKEWQRDPKQLGKLGF
jgi:GTPase